MSKPTKDLLATLNGSEEFRNIFRTRIHALTLSVVYVEYIPSDRYQHPDHGFVRASVKRTTLHHKIERHRLSGEYVNTHYNEAQPAAIAL